MKMLVTFCIALISSLLVVGAVEPRIDRGTKYQHLEQADKKSKRVIRQLEDIAIVDISIEKLSSSEALGYLTRRVVGDKGGGVINFVIRGPDVKKKVSITSKRLTFVQAVDEICRQSSSVWLIEFDANSGAPLLVIKNKSDGKQVDAPTGG